MSNLYNDPYSMLGLTTESLTKDETIGETPAEEDNVTAEITAANSVGTEVTGMENFVDMRERVLMEQRRLEHPTLAEPVADKRQENTIRIITNDNKNFRIYMRSDIWFSSKEVNQLCRFLDTRTSEHTVTFCLGVDMCAEQSNLVGPIISSIITCSGTTIGDAMGLCSLPETMIWSYCKKRLISRYGAVCWSKPGFIKHCPQYESYYREAFKRGVEIGMLSSTDIEDVFTKSSEIMKMYSDVHHETN